ncbi:MAG: D-alanyl-D-alanine carboxypeptidase/D-alanyl-D-alanine-endopeptidase [Polyangiaceae bacterium]|nr:D-alanyl-D-alanine carboxypeptidase/D-alanyl-D-alanine-endopeptidase [Polyangiaceae bacterium]
MRRQRVHFAQWLLVTALGSAPRFVASQPAPMGTAASQPVDTARLVQPAAVSPRASSNFSATDPGQDGSAVTPPLATALRKLVESVTQRGGKLSALVFDLNNDKSVASVAPKVALNPASNQKLLLASGALALLGPGYQFKTGVYGVQRGGSAPSLVLRGNGDPSLGTEDLWILVDTLVARGLVQVNGPIFVDQSAFDDKFTPPAFDQQPNEWAAFRAPVSALALEENTVTLHVIPTEPGKPARAWFTPASMVDVRGTVLTAPKGKASQVRLTLQANGLRLSAQVSGVIAAGQGEQRFTRRVEDPRLMPGYVFRELLLARGVQVAGGVELGGSDVKGRLAQVTSEPLARLAFQLGKESDNFYAEMLLKAIGARAFSGPGSSEGGANALRTWLLAEGLWVESSVLKNGSGLYDANRLSAEQIVNVLRFAQGNSQIGPEFVSHLSVAGRDGTLQRRFPKLKEAAAVRAKTGTLAKAVALSGYAMERGRPRYAFSILVNGVADHASIRPLMDAVVESLVVLPMPPSAKVPR